MRATHLFIHSFFHPSIHPSIHSYFHSSIHPYLFSYPSMRFIHLFRGVVAALGARNLSADVHVHSEGDAAEFAPLAAEFAAALHLNESLLQARPPWSSQTLPITLTKTLTCHNNPETTSD